MHGPRIVRSDAPAVHLHAHLQDRWGNTCSDVAATMHALIDGVVVDSARTPANGWSKASLRVPPVAARIDVAAETSTAVLQGGETVIDIVEDFPSPRAYFCDLHVHSNDTVGTQDTDWNLHYARDIAALDVLGYTANDFQITDDTWDDVVRACRQIAEDGAFVCYPGVEWCGTAGAGGDHNVVFLGEDTTLARSLEWHQRMATTAPTPQTWPVTQLYAAYEKDPESYLLIPHVGGRRAILDWHHPELERLIEVHSAWGVAHGSSKTPWRAAYGWGRAPPAMNTADGRGPGRQAPTSSAASAGSPASSRRPFPPQTSVVRCAPAAPGPQPVRARSPCCTAVRTGWVTSSPLTPEN